MEHRSVPMLRLSRRASFCFLAGFLLPVLLFAQDPSGSATINAGFNHDLPPCEFVDASGQPSGMHVDMLREVARSAGLQVKFVPGVPSQQEKDIETGKLDILAGVPVSASRRELFDLSTPHGYVDYAIFARLGSPIQSVADLNGRTVVMYRCDALASYLAGQGLKCDIVVVDSIAESLSLLKVSGYDCAILPKYTGRYRLALENDKDIAVSGKTDIRLEYAFAVKRGNSELIGKLNAALSAVMSGAGYRDLSQKWLKDVEVPRPVSAPPYLAWAVSGGMVVGILVISVLMIVRYRLRSRNARFKAEELERQVWEQKRVQEQLEAQRESLISLLKTAPHGVVVLNGVDKDAEIAYLNQAATRITGYESSDVSNLQQVVEQTFPDKEYRDKLAHRWQRLAQGGFEEGGFSTVFTDKQGEIKRIDFQAGPLGGGRVVLMFSDVTERYKMQEQQRLLDEQIRQSQKLESMGQLAGGIAHDFNNLLTSIMGNAQLLQMELCEKGGDTMEMVDQILTASKRAGELTTQLLAYARKGKYNVTRVDVHEIIGEVAKLLEHSIHRMIKIKLDLQAERPAIMGDPSQVHGALLNLGVNARDAMPEGGVLTYSTRMVVVDEEFRRTINRDIPVGDYLEIKITDTGVGMEKQVMERIFEPFFTTKAPGKGTGLGLAAVYGCVKNHHGVVTVNSEVGVGTVFTVLFPTVGETAEKELSMESQDRASEVVRGKGHILLCDDEEDIRRLTSKALRKLGYKVSLAADGAEGVKFFKENHAEIDLVILDMIMPNMDGRAAFSEMKKINRSVRVIVVSGFADETAARRCMHEGALDFIAKPFWIGDLSQAVATYIGS